MKLLTAAMMVACLMGLSAVDSCKPPKNPCGFEGFPCANGASYGCKKQYCWSQCNALNIGGEWCYVKYRSNGNWITCTKNEDCVDGTSCGLAYCGSGCTIASKRFRFFRHLGLHMRAPEEDFPEMN